VHVFKIAGDDDDETTGDGGNLPHNNQVISGIPREAFRFFDAPYTDDSFLPNAFRHDISIRDDLFPATWMHKTDLDSLS
jgi:hypothetical protein